MQIHDYSSKNRLCGVPRQLPPHPNLGTAGEMDEVEGKSREGEEGQQEMMNEGDEEEEEMSKSMTKKNRVKKVKG